jgi:hypothetical protein
MDVRISKPLVFDGKTYSKKVVVAEAIAATDTTPARAEEAIYSLSLDLESLTGNDYLFCEREALAETANVPALDPRLSATFQAQIASAASKVPSGALRSLPARDYGAIVTAVRDFFLGLE